MHDLNCRLLLVASLVALALTGCPNREAPIEVRILQPQSPDPLEDVTHLRFRVLDSAGLEVLEQVETLGAGGATLEQIPAGRPLRLQVAGFDGAPPTGTLQSLGLSKQFTVPEELASDAAAIRVDVFLRRVEAFSPVVSAEAPDRPLTLSEPRAGHTATLLEDGRVLIAGGFEGTGADPLTWTYKSTVELFDPATGTVSTDSPAMTYRQNLTLRAFHTATRLQNNQVLIVGGEAGTPPDKKPAVRLATTPSAILFDPGVDQGRGGWAPMSLRQPRSRHTAVLDRNGKVLLMGGIDFTDGASGPAFADKFEWFDPDVTRFNLQAEAGALSRVGHTAIAALGGRYILAAGGIVQPVDAGTPLPARFAGADEMDKDALKFFEFDSGQMVARAGYNYAVGRSFPASALLGQDKVLIIGGFRSFDSSKPWDLFPPDPYSGTEVVRVSGKVSTETGPLLGTGRGHVCAVTLQDGRVLAIGGRGGTGGQPLGSLALTSILTDKTDKVVAEVGEPLLEPRYFHTCTLLADGSVLVTGGVHQQGDSFSTLSSMEIFVPRPAGD